MSYGTTPQGFKLKRLPEILADIEAGCRVVFGPGVIQSPQSPLGNLNGLMASIAADSWEVGLSVYQSYDPDQAEGARLDALGKLRLIGRAPGEGDDSFRPDVTNAGRARIDVSDLLRAVRAVPDVSWARVYVNDSDATDANGMSAHSVAVAALGGDDASIAAAVRTYVVPGVASFGNVAVNLIVDGVCRTVYVLRPVPVEVSMSLNVRVRNDANGCPPPAPAAIAVTLGQLLSAPATRLANGEDVALHPMRTLLATRHPNVEIVGGSAGRGDEPWTSLPLPIGFLEIADIAASRITISVVA
jgi:hypothetical protein